MSDESDKNSPSERNLRELEKGIKTDLSDDLSYGEYLGLAELLDAQHPRSDPPHHDEMLFIIQHQTSELWLKLIIHELKAAVGHIREDNPGPVSKSLARVKQVQHQLFEQWSVLETLTPNEYSEFRDVLGGASGFQSLQYRIVEFILGNKNESVTAVFEHDPRGLKDLRDALESPSIYDEYLMFLSRKGHAIPPACLDRDWKQPHRRNPDLVPVFQLIYQHPNKFWVEYELCEKLMDVEQSFQLWRFRHLKTVERIIGFKHGTGGSSGVGFLKKALELTFFPELLDVRTEIGN